MTYALDPATHEQEDPASGSRSSYLKGNLLIKSLLLIIGVQSGHVDRVQVVQLTTLNKFKISIKRFPAAMLSSCLSFSGVKPVRNGKTTNRDRNLRVFFCIGNPLS